MLPRIQVVHVFNIIEYLCPSPESKVLLKVSLDTSIPNQDNGGMYRSNTCGTDCKYRYPLEIRATYPDSLMLSLAQDPFPKLPRQSNSEARQESAPLHSHSSENIRNFLLSPPVLYVQLQL